MRNNLTSPEGLGHFVHIEKIDKVQWLPTDIPGQIVTGSAHIPVLLGLD